MPFDVMVKVKNLSRQYGHDLAVQSLTFEVKRGEVMGLLGPNGAGKSTVMKVLACFLPPSSGDVTVGGFPLDASLAIRRMVGYLPEYAPAYRDFDVETHLQFVGQMHAIPRGTRRDKIAEISHACGLDRVMFRRIGELSKGFQQRVGLAASMLHDPQLLILDEPTTGLDPNQMIEIRHLIRHLGQKKTVLLSSHILSEVEAVCDRMMIMNQGKLQALGTPEALAKQAFAGTTIRVTIQMNAAQVLARLGKEVPGLQVSNKQWLEHGTLCCLLSCPDTDCTLAEKLFYAAVAEHAVLLEVRKEKTSLEDVFRQLTAVQTCV